VPITTRSIDLLLRGVRAEFAVVIDQAEKQISSYDANVYLDATTKTGALFEERNAVGKQREEAISITGVNQLIPTEELQAFPETTYVPSYITTVEPYKFARRIKVSQESADRRDSKYQKALNEASKLNIAYANTRNKHRFDRFNTAFAVITTQKHLFDYGDAGTTVALVSASHPDKIGGTHSNLVTASDIAPTTVESMILVLQNQVDDIGEPMPMGGTTNYLVVPPAKVKKAKEQIESEWIPFVANNEINVWKGMGWLMVCSPYLSATNGGSNTAWFVLDSMFSPLKDVVFKSVTNETWYEDDTKAFVHDVSFEHKVGALIVVHPKPSLINGENPVVGNAQEPQKGLATTKREGLLQRVCNSLNTAYNLMKAVSMAEMSVPLQCMC
jgi:hypothetical protein